MTYRHKKKTACILACTMTVALLMTGCTQTTQIQTDKKVQTEDKLQIGFSFDSFVIERWLRDRDVFVSTAQELGAEVNVQSATGVVEEQIEQIDYFIQKKMDVIAIIPIDGDALKDVVRRARDAGIRVVCYDRLIHDVDADLYISFDNEMVGTLMGEALKEALPEGGNIFALYGSGSDNNVSQVQKGFTDALEGSDIHIVYANYCDNWLAELAFDYVYEGLEENARLDGLMCGNDDLASQAIRALSELRLAGTIPVVAQDAELAACQRIVEGTQTMTVYKSVADEATAAAYLSVALAKGEDITDPTGEYAASETTSDGTYDIPYYRLEPVAVTADNMDEIIIDSGFHRREDVYMNIAGAETEVN